MSFLEFTPFNRDANLNSGDEKNVSFQKLIKDSDKRKEVHLNLFKQEQQQEVYNPAKVLEAIELYNTGGYYDGKLSDSEFEVFAEEVYSPVSFKFQRNLKDILKNATGIIKRITDSVVF